MTFDNNGDGVIDRVPTDDHQLWHALNEPSAGL